MKFRWHEVEDAVELGLCECWDYTKLRRCEVRTM